MILAIRTDKPEAELYLLDDQGAVIAEHAWLADRQLSQNLLATLVRFLDKNGVKPEQLGGLAVFEGPGSFTGLRIGITVANTLAYSLSIPVVATTGKNWLKAGAHELKTAQAGSYATPHYGQAANISRPKK